MFTLFLLGKEFIFLLSFLLVFVIAVFSLQYLNTPLHYAAANRLTEICSFLAEHGSSLDAVNKVSHLSLVIPEIEETLTLQASTLAKTSLSSIVCEVFDMFLMELFASYQLDEPC